MTSNCWSTIIKHKRSLLILYFFIISSCSVNPYKELDYSGQDTIFGTIVNITSVIIEEDPITDNPNEVKQGVELMIQTDRGRSISIIQKIDKYNFILGDAIKIIKSNNQSRVIPSK